VVTLTNTNIYTGGTILSAPTVSISSLANIGGVESAITFSGGTLQVTGTAVTNLDTNTVNWASFSGGIDVADSTNTFTMNNAVTGGSNFWKNGSGSLVMNAAFVFTGNVNFYSGTTKITSGSSVTCANSSVQGGSTLNLSGSANLTSGNNVNVGESGNGTLNIGLISTDSATATVNTGVYAGGGTNTGIIYVRGDSTTLTTTGATSSYNEIQIGDWGTGYGELNIYDHAKVKTDSLYVARWNSSTGLITVNDYATVTARNVMVGSNATGTTTGGTMKLNNHATLTVTGTLYAGAWTSGTINVNDNATVTAPTIWVGDWMDPASSFSGTLTVSNTASVTSTGELVVGRQTNGNLSINTDATVTVSGNFITNQMGYTGGSGKEVTTANITIGGSGGDRVALQVGGDLSMEDNWCNSITNFTITESAKVNVTGDCYVGRWANAVGNLNLDTNAQLNIGGQLIICQYDAAQGYVNVSGNAKLKAAGINLSAGPISWDWNYDTQQLNISDNALVTSTADVTIGATALHSGGFITLTGTGQLTVAGNLTEGYNGGAWNAITNSSTKSILVSGNLNLNAGGIYVTGITNDGTGVAGGIDVLGTVKLNGGTIYATAANSDFITSPILVQSGGAVINTQWNSLAINQALAQDPSSTGGGLVIWNGGTVTLTRALTYTGTTDIDNTWCTLKIDTSITGTTSLVGTVTGSGGLTKAGAGILALSGTLSYTGTTTIDAGTLQIDTSTTGTTSLVGNITGSGGLTKAGAGTLTLSGTLNYTGTTTINTGTLQIDTSGTSTLTDITGSGTLQVGNGTTSTTLIADSISVDTLTIGAGSIVDDAISSDTVTSGGELTTVPEPSTFVLLSIAALGLIGAAWRRRDR
jgi:autotransporter-associated beta strand protein